MGDGRKMLDVLRGHNRLAVSRQVPGHPGATIHHQEDFVAMLKKLSREEVDEFVESLSRLHTNKETKP